MPDIAVRDFENWSLAGLAALDWRGGPDLTLLLFLAVLADSLFGAVLCPLGISPVRVVAHDAGFFERRLNRETRSESTRIARGFVSLILLAGAAAAAGWGVLRFLHPLHFGWIVEFGLVIILLRQRTGIESLLRVGRAIAQGRSGEARVLLGAWNRTDRDFSDDHELARAVIEEGARNLVHGLVGVVFWYLLLGLPGLLAYRTVETVEGVVGRRDPARRAFGISSARLDDAASYIPARIGGLLIGFAAIFVPGASPARAFRTIRTAPRTPLGPNARWTLGAAAGALDLALGGPLRRDGKVVKALWVGEGRARTAVSDLRWAAMLFSVVGLLVAGLVALLAATRHLM